MQIRMSLCHGQTELIAAGENQISFMKMRTILILLCLAQMNCPHEEPTQAPRETLGDRSGKFGPHGAAIASVRQPITITTVVSIDYGFCDRN
jgi:hypothetical protein